MLGLPIIRQCDLPAQKNKKGKLLVAVHVSR